MKALFDLDSPLVSVEALANKMGRDDLRVLYTSMCDPFTKVPEPLPENWIPHTQPFDFENVFCDPDSLQPHTLPSPQRFAQLAGKMGISKDNDIVVYDGKGLYSAARAWFMFRLMGHKRVWLLDGGLPAWSAFGGPIANASLSARQQNTHFTSSMQSDKTRDKEDILRELAQDNLTVVDARSADRFAGKAKEPREGVRSGHIPGAVNLPFTQLIHSGKLLTKNELNTVFDELVNPQCHLTFSCGSGVTACILGLAAEVSGRQNWSVYDGSWSEWGSDLKLPIARG